MSRVVLAAAAIPPANGPAEAPAANPLLPAAKALAKPCPKFLYPNCFLLILERFAVLSISLARVSKLSLLL